MFARTRDPLTVLLSTMMFSSVIRGSVDGTATFCPITTEPLDTETGTVALNGWSTMRTPDLFWKAFRAPEGTAMAAMNAPPDEFVDVTGGTAVAVVADFGGGGRGRRAAEVPLVALPTMLGSIMVILKARVKFNCNTR